MADVNGILVFCESANGKLASIALEVLGVGRRIADELGQKLEAVLIGNHIGSLADEAVYYGADRVYVVEDPSLDNYLTDLYLLALEKVIRQANPQVVILGQTVAGRDLAPRLAFRLNTAAALDCISLEVDKNTGRLLMTRPVYGGNAHAILVCDTDPQIATIRSKAMSPAVRDTSQKGEIIKITAELNSAGVKTRLLERKIEEAGGVKLEDARVVVTGGRGIGGPEGFKQLEELAKILKGAVGASRPPCDNKWVPDNLQVGLTGKIVSPDLYIAVGVSGSSQHLSGCSGSRVIVAINKDAEANIFKVAHFGVVADWKKALPAFIARVKDLVSG